MFSYITGRITEREDGVLTLENNGIGYEINVSAIAQRNLSEFDGEVKIYTYYQAREDGVSLFGFYSKEEKDVFLKLITVSGVGPKGAISILSNIEVNDLCVVIASQNISALSSVKGIGKKTAERLIVELKNKITVSGNLASSMSDLTYPSSSELDDAVQVLCSLGLTRQEAVKSAESVYSAGDTAEDIITKALRKNG